MIKDFSKEDIKQIEQQGLSLAEIKEQITALKKEQSYVEIDRAAALGDGIRSYSEGEIDKYINLYEKALADYSIVKFVHVCLNHYKISIIPRMLFMKKRLLTLSSFLSKLKILLFIGIWKILYKVMVSL
jgi:hypothetical protein